ncbi:ankyrin repeat domain-containing protein [Infirmifilum lucidum]|uniref:Ankyrin repeat domain-containing protein n=1 Tax=Infirmifilum lucidum TaxID=2776706 RepID=A0A7L9FGL2_9CREN|nr:ankyrin repeat domain-containing protein [Infirmifilum lucidum]QOJ78899.1 ankyrin repeat domain-containing protein [Infirmifilum lucidum]
MQGPVDRELLEAAARGDYGKVKELLDRGADVNTRDKYGWTPLHYAADGGHLEVARLLLDRGADVNTRDNDGRTPLDLARAMGHKEVVELLESVGEHGR